MASTNRFGIGIGEANADPVERLSILTNGYVGIGFTNPSVELEVNGTGKADKWIDSQGFDLGKIGTALATIHDVVESVDDLQGLKNLLKLVLDNLRDEIPPDPPPGPPIYPPS